MKKLFAILLTCVLQFYVSCCAEMKLRLLWIVPLAAGFDYMFLAFMHMAKR